MAETPEFDEEFEAGPPHRGEGIPWGAVVGTLGVILLVVFAVQNTETVAIEFLWVSGEYPLSIVILVTAVSAGLLTLISGAFLRRRRRARRAEKQELQHLRGDD
jgi:uncharacterized integral membrane protein